MLFIRLLFHVILFREGVPFQKILRSASVFAVFRFLVLFKLLTVVKIFVAGLAVFLVMHLYMHLDTTLSSETTGAFRATPKPYIGMHREHMLVIILHPDFQTTKFTFHWIL